ncbi:MAG: hypothetical protein FWB71_04225 [Defluviitaleaceae bacterium]|nr:hypothetical protein [Defluviitaleaceae bacterium]
MFVKSIPKRKISFGWGSLAILAVPLAIYPAYLFYDNLTFLAMMLHRLDAYVDLPRATFQIRAVIFGLISLAIVSGGAIVGVKFRNKHRFAESGMVLCIGMISVFVVILLFLALTHFVRTMPTQEWDPWAMLISDYCARF